MNMSKNGKASATLYSVAFREFLKGDQIYLAENFFQVVKNIFTLNLSLIFSKRGPSHNSFLKYDTVCVQPHI